MKIYCNGDLIEKEQVTELFEPGFLFGWGVFEALRTYAGNIPFLDAHIARLNESLELLGIGKIELDWSKTITDLLQENRLEDAYVRITAYKKRKGTGLLIYADTFGYYTADIYKEGFSAIISPHRRCGKNICSKSKSLSYLQNRISWLAAQKVKKDEALVLNPEGFLAGGSRSNLFLVKNKEIFTPAIECGAFAGITRKAVMEIAAELGLAVKEGKLTVDDIDDCKEAFITSALLEVMPLVECAGKLLSKGKPGEMTGKILGHYRERLKVKAA